jgi:predicted RNase H-like HicB family nuclease
MLRYYAIFYQLKDEWGVRFPDIDAIHTSGKDIDEAFNMATDALSAILVYGRKGREYKEPSSFESVLAQAEAGAHVMAVIPDESIMEEYRPKKRVNVMVPVDLLKKIDNVKKEKGLDRSKLFCDAAEKYLAS